MYTCPMHPEVRQEKPGLCPECGMNLVVEKDHEEHGERKGHDKHAGHSTQAFLKKFWVSLVLSIPVVLYSDILKELFSWEAPAFPGSQHIPLLLGSVIFFYGGWIFLVSSWRELKARSPGMMTLIALAIVTAYSYSLFVVVQGYGDTLFWELSTLIVVMLLGHWIEMRAVQGAQGALRELSKLLPDTAEVVREGTTETVPLEQLREGDIVLVRPGAKVPADGTVKEGVSEVNEAMVTGESAPVRKAPNSSVIGGTVNGDGSLKVEVARIGERTFLAGVMRLVKEAEASKSKLQMLSDRAAYLLTIIAIGAASLTFLVWILLQAEFSFALERLVAVLVIACPHALGLAIPLVASISTTKAAQSGFLVKQRLALESARNINVVLFDKTGTLTKGEYGVTNVWNLHAQSEQDLLKLAASVGAFSEHAASKAIVKKAEEMGAELLETRDFARLPGKGVRARVHGREISVGGLALLEGLDFVLPPGAEEENRKGKTLIFVKEEKQVLGMFALSDAVREESREAVRALRDMGIRVAMITGDSEQVAAFVAQDLGIDEYFSRVLPGKKAEKVRLLQERGLKVAMVGDGINDAPALTQADVGIAIGAGTNVAIESAGIILVRNDPRDIAKIVRLSRMTFSKMVQNLFWATGYNVVAIPLAAGVLAFQGIFLQPALAALFMSLSTVIVAVNALLLRAKSLE
ncbi:MAG: copper-translocating P-type ATPase [bacterium]|nr:copper-translocating P-type ATPase [bacterium]